ncbi:MAG: sigma-70 family RNA polymerase sigma factor [Planctomycetota bacterium]
MASDAELVEQSRSGQLAAYDQLVRRWSARVAAYIRGKVSRPHIVEELAQETFLRGYKSLASLSDPAKFGSWLLSIAHRLILDWRKARSSSEVNISALSDDGELANGEMPGSTNRASDISPSSRMEHREQKKQLWEYVDKLPEQLREVVLIYYCDQLSYRETAELLQVSVPTVGVRLARARKMLRQRMTDGAGRDRVTR